MERSLYTHTIDTLLMDLVGRGFKRGIVKAYESGETITPPPYPKPLPIPRWDLFEDNDGRIRLIDLHTPIAGSMQREHIEEEVFASGRLEVDGSFASWVLIETYGGSRIRLDAQTHPTLDSLPTLLGQFCDPDIAFD